MTLVNTVVPPYILAEKPRYRSWVGTGSLPTVRLVHLR